jgi:hypothetical protein
VREILVRTVAPAVLVIIEQEAPTRVVLTGGRADDERLAAWLAASEARQLVYAAALADREASGGRPRERAWAQELLSDPGGIVRAVERLLDG